MKTIHIPVILLSVILPSMLWLSGCVDESIGPPGPQGDRGPQGPKGDPGESGFVFEYEDINFTAPSYDIILDYSPDFEGLDSDVALVYLLWEVVEEDGELIDIWRPLPQTVLHPEGTLYYNYDFTKYNVRLFLDATFPLDLLGAIDTDGWVVRVVVVPGNFWNSGRIDFSDYNQVKEALGLPELGQHDATRRRAIQ